MGRSVELGVDLEYSTGGGSELAVQLLHTRRSKRVVVAMRVGRSAWK